MNFQILFRVFLTFLLLVFSGRLLALDIHDPKQALQAYAQQDDGAFHYDHIASIPVPGVTLHLYSMISQVWRSSDEIDRTLWQHQLVIAVPDQVAFDTAMLFVGDNDNDDPLVDENDIIVQIIAQLAQGSQTIVAAVYQVPNQPFYFPNYTARYKEDDLVGYTWDKYLDTGDTTWPIHVPMTKSVIKAMDAVSEIAPTLGDYAVNDFVVTGFSKRGQVTWLAAAIDSRIKAIAPGVIDFLNVMPNMENQYKSYGAYVPEIDTLVQLGVMGRLRTPEFEDLADIIDPYEYRDRLQLPKFLLNSSGDQFFMPDSAKFYFKDLPGEKLIRYAPNTDHSLQNSVTSVFDTLYSLLGWYQSILLGLERPQIDWYLDGNQLVAETSMTPQLARVWRASNPLARDFRKVSIGEAWVAEPIQADADGRYRTVLPQPQTGYAAAYIEFVYQGIGGLPVTYSTRVYITPDSFPFTMTGPLNDPKPAPYWDRQLERALAGGNSDVSVEDFESYLPIPVFGEYVSGTDQLSSMLDMGFLFKGAMADVARRECMATRLNIKSRRLGWYTDIDLANLGENKAWAYYRFADAAMDYGFDGLAAYICRRLNRL